MNKSDLILNLIYHLFYVDSLAHAGKGKGAKAEFAQGKNPPAPLLVLRQTWT